RKGLADSVAREEIIRFSGKMYDPVVVEAFLEISADEIGALFAEAESAKLI
ncbi:MAG: two-component system response regulator, partial [Candidatus Melainabacteria bacterium HGW-Melainabacteria-1]